MYAFGRGCCVTVAARWRHCTDAGCKTQCSDSQCTGSMEQPCDRSLVSTVESPLQAESAITAATTAVTMATAMAATATMDGTVGAIMVETMGGRTDKGGTTTTAVATATMAGTCTLSSRSSLILPSAAICT